MKRTKHNLRLLLAGGIIALFACFTAGAANILKLDVTNALTDPLSWTGGVVPGSADIAQFDGATAYASTNSWPLGAPLIWQGIQVLSPTNSLTFQNDNTLTNGTSGIDLSVGVNNLTLNCAVVLGASQAFTAGAGRIITVNGGISDGGAAPIMVVTVLLLCAYCCAATVICAWLLIAVWSGVRLVLLSAPSEWTSLKSTAYCGLASARGAGGRSWLALWSTNGVTCGVCVNPAGANVGGVNWYSPGPVPG